MNKNEQANQIAELLSLIPGLDSFYELHKEIKGVKNLLSSYEKFLKDHNQYSSDIEVKIKIIMEKYEDLIESSDDGSGIFHISHHLKVDDYDIISDFLNDRSRLINKKPKFKPAEHQHYKTITETIVYHEVDYNSILQKYDSCDHPFICSQIGIAYNESKQYHIGLSYLNKALKHVFSYPNIYWNNYYGVLGCADAIHELQHLLGAENLIKLPHLSISSVLSCIYLYFSRVIHMFDNEEYSGSSEGIPYHIHNKINYLSIRADLILHYRQYFVPVFGLGINPDIQYMADKAFAHGLGDKYNIGLITYSAFKDALKMCQHGSLIPNFSGGYHDIEDATFGELIERGQKRSIKIAKDLYNEFREGKFRLNNEQLDDIMVALWNKLQK